MEIYYTQEAQQQWSAGRGLRDSEGGWALWLPSNVMLELRSVPRVSRGPEADAAEGMSVRPRGEGLVVSVLWQYNPDTLIGERHSPTCGSWPLATCGRWGRGVGGALEAYS